MGSTVSPKSRQTRQKGKPAPESPVRRALPSGHVPAHRLQTASLRVPIHGRCICGEKSKNGVLQQRITEQALGRRVHTLHKTPSPQCRMRARTAHELASSERLQSWRTVQAGLMSKRGKSVHGCKLLPASAVRWHGVCPAQMCNRLPTAGHREMLAESTMLRPCRSIAPAHLQGRTKHRYLQDNASMSARRLHLQGSTPWHCR